MRTRVDKAAVIYFVFRVAFFSGFYFVELMLMLLMHRRSLLIRFLARERTMQHKNLIEAFNGTLPECIIKSLEALAQSD